MNCEVCGFDLYHVVTHLDVSILSLYSDARFPGRAIVALREHYSDLEEVPEGLYHRFLDDVRRAGVIIKRVTCTARMNYAILGNAVQHVHAHVIPRVLGGDPVPTKAPWAHPDPVSPMTNGDLMQMNVDIRRALRRQGMV